MSGKFPLVRKLIGKDQPAEEQKNAADAEEVVEEKEDDEEERKKEGALAKLITYARNKFLKLGIEGSISITRLSGVVTTTISCDVAASDDENAEEQEDLEGVDTKTLRAIDGILKNILKRSKNWEGKVYAKDMSIARSVTVGFCLSFFISVGFSITIELSATVNSLLEANKKLQK